MCGDTSYVGKKYLNYFPFKICIYFAFKLAHFDDKKIDFVQIND